VEYVIIFRNITIRLTEDGEFVAWQTAPATLAVADLQRLTARNSALFPAVLCFALSLEVEDFCGERDVAS